MAGVTKRLTPDQFVSRAMAAPGIPWVRWRSDWSGADCFGVIVLYFREVLGIDLGPVPQTDIAAGFESASGWVEASGPESNATAWMAFLGGRPRHCGVILPNGQILHSEGSEDHPGSVRVSRLAAVARVYGQIKFYRYAPC